MTRTEGRQHRLGMTWLALALALVALALLAMPAAGVAKDRNHDRIPDRWEKRHKLSLNVNQARRDQDRDRLRNRAEFLAGTNPRSSDSDGDGTIDGKEQAGTIISFDEGTGRLVVDLFGGETIGGLVTEETEITCEDSAPAASTSTDDAEPGEENEEEPGEGDGESDEGEDSEEPGEDGDDGDNEGPGDGEGAEGPDDNSGPGENSGPGNENDEGERACGTVELVPGAVVEEAELELRNGRVFFEEVELSGREV
jgi:hypothetical protein